MTSEELLQVAARVKRGTRNEDIILVCTALERYVVERQRMGMVGRPRLGHRAETLSATKPWAAEGMSRATWYRRQGVKRSD